MTATPERRAELIAAAAAEELTPEEAVELDALRLVDPTADLEIDELRELIRTVSTAVPQWDAGTPSAGLRARVAGISDQEEVDEAALVEPSRDATVSRLDRHQASGAPRTAAPRRTAPRRRWAVSIVAAAACLALGFGIGALVLPTGPSGPQPGSPGQLGALEQIDFRDEPSGVSIDASVVAHTWGTETIMEIEGLVAGETYDLLLIDGEGDSHPSGSFTGSTAVIDCRMNAATLRPDAASLEIRDDTGALVTAASLPPVSG